MKKHFFFIFVILFSTNIWAQTNQDSTNNEDIEEMMGMIVEYMFAINDTDKQVDDYFNKIDIENSGCRSEKVWISTIVGSDGMLRNTKVVRSVNPICDSIALNFVLGLKGWVPAITRNRYVTAPLTLPIVFDVAELKMRLASLHPTSVEEHCRRREIIDLIRCDSCIAIPNDFRIFLDFTAHQLTSNNRTPYIIPYERPKRKNRVKVALNDSKTRGINFIIFDSEKGHVLNYLSAKSRQYLYIEKDKKILLIGFIQDENNPLIAVYNGISFSNDTTLSLEFRHYQKPELITEIGIP